MKGWKRIVALAVLLPVLIAAGCGRGPGAAPGETIGGGASAGGGVNAPEAESGPKKLADFVLIPLWITALEEDQSELRLLVGHHLAETRTVEISCQEVLLDGAAAEGWTVRIPEGAAEVFVTEPDMGYTQILTLGVNLEDYQELTIRATAAYDDGTEPYPFSAVIKISELERRLKK